MKKFIAVMLIAVSTYMLLSFVSLIGCNVQAKADVIEYGQGLNNENIFVEKRPVARVTEQVTSLTYESYTIAFVKYLEWESAVTATVTENYGIQFLVAQNNEIQTALDVDFTGLIDNDGTVDVTFSRYRFYGDVTTLFNERTIATTRESNSLGVTYKILKFTSGQKTFRIEIDPVTSSTNPRFSNLTQMNYNYLELNSSDIKQIWVDGYNKASVTRLEDLTPFGMIKRGVDDILNIQLMPGLKLSTLFSIAIGLIFMGIIMKLFLGG